MLVSLDLWLPELLGAPGWCVSSRCFPAVAAPRGVTLQHIRILGFFWHSSQGACSVRGIHSGHLFDPVDMAEEVFAGSGHPLSPGHCFPSRWDCGCKSTPESPPGHCHCSRDASQSLLPGICRAINQRGCLWKMLLSSSLSFYLLGAPINHSSQSPAEHCGGSSHTQPCPGFREHSGQLSQLRTPHKPNSLFLLSSQAVFALCSL